MTLETRGSQSTPTEFTPVNSIEGPGIYRLSGLEYLPNFDSDFKYELRKRNSGISAIIFNEATLINGEYTPASLEYQATWDNTHLGTNNVVIDGEIFNITGTSNSSNGSGNGSFSIEDIGNLSVVKNKLVYALSEGRDGLFSLFASGGVRHFRRDSSCAWSGKLTIGGEKPGKLVRSTIDIFNDWSKDLSRGIQISKNH